MHPALRTATSMVARDVVGLAMDAANYALHEAKPDDFEDYRMRLQIWSEGGLTAGNLVMDIPLVLMPTDFSQNTIARTQVIDTLGGKAIIHSPYESSSSSITMRGRIGPTFRAMYYIEPEKGVPQPKLVILNGYGFVRRLEKFVKLSRQIDEKGYPRKVVLVNTMYNEVTRVVINSFEVSITDQMNFVWNYSLSLQKVGILDDSFDNLVVKATIKSLLLTEITGIAIKYAQKAMAQYVAPVMFNLLSL